STYVSMADIMIALWLWTQSPYPFFLNTSAPSQIYSLSLHDALPISKVFGITVCLDSVSGHPIHFPSGQAGTDRIDGGLLRLPHQDRKSTRLNSSHVKISYAVFCLKKKKNMTLQ